MEQAVIVQAAVLYSRGIICGEAEYRNRSPLRSVRGSLIARRCLVMARATDCHRLDGFSALMLPLFVGLVWPIPHPLATLCPSPINPPPSLPSTPLPILPFTIIPCPTIHAHISAH